MPRIPTADALGTPQLDAVYPSVGGAGAGLAQFAGVGEQAQRYGGQLLERQKQANDASWISTTIAKTRGDWTQKFLDAQTKAPAGAPDFTAGLMGQFNDQTKQLAESAPSPEARAAFEERLSLFGEDLAAKATVFEGTERVRKRRSDLADTIDLNAATIRKDPHQYDETRIETLAAIQSSDLPADAKDELTRAAKGELATAQVNALIDSNPGAAKSALIGGAWAGELPPHEVERLANNADVEIRRREAEARAAAAQARSIAIQQQSDLYRDEAAAAEQGKTLGLVDEKSLAAAYGSDKAGKLMADLTATRETAIAINGLALLPPEERAAEVAKAKPAEGAGFADQQARYDAMAKADAQIGQAYASDPAGAAFAFSPAVQQGFKTADESGKAEDLQRAVEMSLAVQMQAGVPETRRRVISDSQAQLVVEKIKQAPAEQAADLVQGQAVAYGDYWPQVYGELVKAGLPSNYRVLATTDDPVARKQLADVLSAPQAELRKQAGDKAKDIEDAVDQNLAAFAGTQSFFDRGGQVYADYHDAVLSLAYKLGASQDAGAAAEQAAQIVNAKYDFVETAPHNWGGTIVARAPKDQGDQAAQWAIYALQQLTPENLKDPGGYTPETLALTSEQRRKLYLDNNISAGHWLTNEHDNGWFLVDDRWQPVRRADGHRVEFLFSDIVPLQVHRPERLTVGGYTLEPVPK